MPTFFLALLSKAEDHLPSVVRPSIPLNAFSSEPHKPIFFKRNMDPSIIGELKICINGHGLLSTMAAMPIYGKNAKNLLQNHESFEAESWYIASETQGLPTLFK